jgi:hypothetical protein
VARPKKDRYFNGVKLEDNLYIGIKQRKNHYRYIRPDGTARFFTANTVHQANERARQANAKREGYQSIRVAKTKPTMMLDFIEEYIPYRETHSPRLKTKESWRDRCYKLRKFGREMTLPFSRLARNHIVEWWEGLTYYQQKARHAELRKLFNYLMTRELVPNFEYNPFTTSDDRPRLYLKEEPNRTRERLTINGFWKIYEAAGELGYEGLQIAMGISLVTFMREQDVILLRTDKHLDGKVLKCTIGKSAAQKGMAKASRLQWDTNTHTLLKELIDKGKRLGMRNNNCPYIVNHMPKQKRVGKTKDHFAQIAQRRLISMFTEARNATHLWDDLPAGIKPPTFHEIRSLADATASHQGFELETIQHAMAHSDKSQTLLYQANHDLPHEEVNIIFDRKFIGGSFV